MRLPEVLPLFQCRRCGKLTLSKPENGCGMCGRKLFRTVTYFSAEAGR